jgi:hypothetical protein
VPDLFGSLTTVSKQTRNCEYVTSPSVKIASISMNDMLVPFVGERLPSVAAHRCSDERGYRVAVPELTRLCRELLGNDDKKKTAFETRRKELAEKHKARRAKWRADAEGQRIAKRKFLRHGWGLEIGEAVKREDWVLVNGTSNGWTRRLVGFHEARTNLSAVAAARVWATVPVRPSVLLWRSRIAASSQSRFSPTATC